MLLILIYLSVLAVVGHIVINLYNGFVCGRNEVKNAGSAIDVQLKMRHDLIPGVILQKSVLLPISSFNFIS
jgi:hypothetical protein